MHAVEWLVIEARGPWRRDVGSGDGLPDDAREAVAAWLRDERSGLPRRVLFVRRPGRAAGELLVHRVTASEDRREVRRVAIGDHAGLSRIRLDQAGERVRKRLVLVCGHGARDRCCARAGAPVCAALADSLPDDELWISSHQGGHRFAANVLLLPDGVQLGRVPADGAAAVVARALAGEIALSHYRGRSCHTPEEQAAEHAIRVATGITRVDDLRVVDRGESETRVRFRDSGGRVHTAAVERVAGPEVSASCGAPLEPQAPLRGRVAE